MSDYSIDNLLLNIKVEENNTANTVNKIARSIDKIMSSLVKFDTEGLDDKFSEIGEALSSLKFDGMKDLSANYGKIGTALKNITKVDFDAQKLYKKFSSLTRIVKPFVEELQKSEQALIAMDGILKSRASAFNVRQSGTDNKTTSAKTKGSIFDVGNLYHIVRLVQFVGRGLQKVGDIMKDVVQKGIDYTETMNLWQVAMGKNVDQAEDFINRMAKAYGYATTTLMQYQATFRNMLSNLGGVDSNVSYKLSEYLMQMAGDYASLYNVTIEKAMQSFQSVLAGQVRPIRSVSGYDITENTIFELYQSLGGEKTMRQLSQTEKRLLRIMAIFQQMERSGAVGDLAKTLGNSANQLRIINEQVTELKTWLGNILEMYLRPALPIVQAFLIVATEVAKVIAKNLGYEAFDGTIAGFEESAEKADELAGKLLSFDKFEALNSSSGDNALGIDSKLLEGMAKYESLLDHSKTLAQEMAENILPLFIDENGELTAGAQKIQDAIEKIFGFTKNLYELNEEGGFKAWGDEIEKIIPNLKLLSTIISSMLAVLVGSNLLKSITKIGSAIKGIFTGGPLGKIMLVVGALAYLYETNEGVRASIDELFTALKPLGDLLIGLGTNIIPVIGRVLQDLAPILKLIVNLVTVFVYVFEGLMIVVTAALELIVKVVETISSLLNFEDYGNLGENLKNIWTNWDLSKNYTESLMQSLETSPTMSKVTELVVGYSLTPNGITSPNDSTNFGNYGSTPSVASANDIITQSTYNGTIAANAQNGSAVSVNGNVYLDKHKVGVVMAQSTFKENVRVGNFKK